METKELQVRVYRSPEGVPTCARDFEDGEVCVFLQTARMGKLEVCALQTGVDALLRSPRGTGWLVPHCKCPLWPDKGV